MKLSIITINYNNKAGLQKTIDSVVCQTWRDFEWIVIDGGSTDGSKELIEKYQQHFSYWCSEPDKGVYNAMNKGIDKAKGEYLQFLNSGDCLHDSNVLEHIGEGKDADILYGALNYITQDHGFLVRYPEELTLHFFLCNSLGHPATFIKSCLLKQKGYREDYKIVSDWYRFIEWFRDGNTFHRIDRVIADFDTTGISSTNIKLVDKEKEKVFDELFGKENRQLINESIMLQRKYEGMVNMGILPIKECGGKRLSILLHFIGFLNKTIKRNK